VPVRNVLHSCKAALRYKTAGWGYLLGERRVEVIPSKAGANSQPLHRPGVLYEDPEVVLHLAALCDRCVQHLHGKRHAIAVQLIDVAVDHTVRAPVAGAMLEAYFELVSSRDICDRGGDVLRRSRI